MSKIPDSDTLAKEVATGDKYGAEAAQIKNLFEHHDNAAAADRLRLDAHLAPHELHKLMTALQKECKDVPNCSIVDDRNGIKVTTQLEDAAGEIETKSLFERSAQELAKAHDKIPMTGDLLGLSPDQTRKVLALQADEKSENNGKSHKFGDIVVSLGYRTPDEVNETLRKQDRLNADQTAKDMAHLMPLAHEEGYFQLLKRTHPELADEAATKLAHHLRQINDERTNLHNGDQLPVLTDSEQAQLADRLYKQRVHNTGGVTAQPRQSLSEIPI